MSKILIADPDALESEPGVKAELMTLFRDSEDEEMRRYLALVLGYSRAPEAVPLLVEALDDEDSQLRIYALWGLGALGDPSALEPLTAALSDGDAGIRKTAAFALGELGSREAQGDLERLLEDPVADVRWNAALSLARMGNAAAVPVLERMLDRQLLAQVPDITAEQQEDAMISAVEALTVLRGEAALPTLRPLEESDPSLKVRQAAIEARKAVEGMLRKGSVKLDTRLAGEENAAS
jgi:HEAT repeat protein